jgi:THUMP domain-like
MSPDEVIAKLKLKKGNESRVLVMTRWQGKPVVIVCTEI